MKKGVVTALLFLIVTFPVAVFADEVTTKQLLKEIEALKRKVEDLERKQAEAAKPTELDRMTTESAAQTAQTRQAQPAPEADGTLTKENVGGRYQNNVIANTTVGGYASTEFEDFQNSPSTFDQHRFVVNVGSRLTERLKFYSELEYEHGASFESEGQAAGTLDIDDTNQNGVIDADEANDVPLALDTDSGRSGEIAIEQAWAQYDITENLGVRMGILLMPFGKYNLTHDDDLHNLTDRPLVVRRVIPGTWSEAGAGFVMSSPVGDEASVYGELYIVNGLNDDIATDGGALREARGNFEEDNNNNKAFVGRVAFSPMLGQEVGLSGYTGSYNDDSDNATGTAFDWDFHALGFRLNGEAALFSLERGVNSDGEIVPGTLWGAYTDLSYPFWLPALNDTFLGDGFSDPKLIPVVRYNYAEIDRRDGLSDLDENSVVVGLAYRPEQNFVFKNEFQWNTGELERGDSNGFMSSIALGF